MCNCSRCADRALCDVLDDPDIQFWPPATRLGEICRAVGALMRAVMRYGTVRDRVLIMLLLHTGLRVSEACSLRVDDVELRERSRRVRVRHGKGGKYREVPLNVTIRRVLREYLDSDHPGGEWLPLNRYGERLNERSGERVVKRYAALAGLEGVTVHTLRHTFW